MVLCRMDLMEVGCDVMVSALCESETRSLLWAGEKV